MAGSINRVILVGRLTRDVEVRKTTSGLSVASFSVAVDRRRSSANQQGQDTDFINCVAWRQAADLLGSYGRKGLRVGIEGSITTRNYTNQSGQKVYVTEVQCDNVQLLESRSESQARNDSYSAPSYVQSTPANDPFSTQSNQSYNANDGFDIGDSLDISNDDLPF